MKTFGILVSLVCMTLVTSPALAQRQSRNVTTYGQQDASRADIIPFYGYSWTFSRDLAYYGTYGTGDIKDSGFWGIAIDFKIPRQVGKQIELLYSRQDSQLEYRSPTTKTSGDMAVEYWQIGGVYGIQQGNVLPFGSVTLGATRYIPDFSVGGVKYNEDTWKFSMIFGLGAKVYTQGRFGLRIEARLPITFTSGGAGVACGGGGCYTTVGGSGITQFDVSGGLIIRL